jgi:hypothetical protein
MRLGLYGFSMAKTLRYPDSYAHYLDLVEADYQLKKKTTQKLTPPKQMLDEAQQRLIYMTRETP